MVRHISNTDPDDDASALLDLLDRVDDLPGAAVLGS